MATLLNDAVGGIVDDKGNCTVRIGPGRSNVTWKIARLTTSTDRQDGKNTVLRVYKNYPTAQTLVDSTWTADSNISTTDIILTAGEKLVAVYSQGAPGSQCMLTVAGNVIV